MKLLHKVISEYFANGSNQCQWLLMRKNSGTFYDDYKIQTNRRVFISICTKYKGSEYDEEIEMLRKGHE